MRFRLAWLMVLGVIGAGSLAYVVIQRAIQGTDDSWRALAWPLIGALPLFMFGIWLLSASTSRAALYVALAGTGTAASAAYEAFVWTNPGVVDRPWFPLINIIGLLADDASIVGFLLMISTFPDGGVEHRWQRRVTSLIWAVLLTGPLTLVVDPYVVLPLFADPGVGPVANPYAVPALAGLTPIVHSTFVQPWVVMMLGLVVFFNRAILGDPETRGRMRVMLWVVVWTLLSYPAWFTTEGLGLGGEPIGILTQLMVFAGVVALPAAGIHGVLRHGAFQVAPSRSGDVVLRSSDWLITILYAVAVATPGLVLTELTPASRVLATALTAIALLPVRGRLQSSIRRQVYGNREAHLALLNDLGGKLERARDLGDVATDLARALRDGLEATWVRVSVASADGVRPSSPPGVAGDPAGAPVLVHELAQGDIGLGRIEIGPRRRHGYSPAERSLLATIARLWTTALANDRLTAQLADQLAELATSRTRLVTAQDAERKRIERDLHDGVQQNVVALVAGLRLARNRLQRRELDPDDLVDLQEQAREILSDLRELAHGIHPQVLTDSGLVAAVESRTARFPIPVVVEAGELRAERLNPAVEEVAFYTAQEALANVAKHAGATVARVTLSRSDAALLITVADDGCGFDAGAHDGQHGGLANLRDRVATLGGRLTIESRPGAGTRITAELPLADVSPVAEPGRVAFSLEPPPSEVRHAS